MNIYIDAIIGIIYLLVNISALIIIVIIELFKNTKK